MDWLILEGLTEADRRAVLAATVRHRYRRRATIVGQGDPGHALHLLASGRALVQVSTPGGELATIGIVGPGSCFGEHALVDAGGVRMAAVIALEPVETLALHREDFDRLRHRFPSVNTVLVRALTDRVNGLTEQLLEALFVDVETRVHRRLLELSELYTESGSDAVTVELTQEELAVLAGTSRPTVNRVLADLAGAGIVAVRRGAVDVLDRAALAARAANH